VNCVSNGLPVGKPLAAALEYAARGWHVFPCRPRSKAPAIENGFYRATTNPETIKEYWSNSDRNIGIRTGVASGFWVLDVDDDDGGEASLNALQAKHDRLPITREVTTADGRHLYFRYTQEVRQTVKIAPGLDTRTNGGYVLAPPSIHPDGPVYAWANNAELAIAPDWLLMHSASQFPCRHRSARCRWSATSLRMVVPH
jgi:Bifunctional DNA primase/polymerase, N-terminal